jgi:hypothetical protein
MMRSTPAGTACVNSSGVLVVASMGTRESQPSIASRGRRRGCRLCSRASLYDVAVWASGSMPVHVYEATAWPALRIASSLVAMPRESSTRWMGLRGRIYLGMFVRVWGVGLSFGGCLEDFGIPNGGVRGDMVVGQIGKGFVGRSAGGGCRVFSPPPLCS